MAAAVKTPYCHPYRLSMFQTLLMPLTIDGINVIM